MYFSISAPQDVALPDGQTLSFRVNADDSSLVEIHMLGVDGNEVAGTHILTFKRNGAPADTQFVPTPLYPDYSKSPSVNQDAVRADDWKGSDTPPPKASPTPPAKPVDSKPAA